MVFSVMCCRALNLKNLDLVKEIDVPVEEEEVAEVCHRGHVSFVV